MEELEFDDAPESSRGIIGLCSDATAGLFYAYNENSIFQVSFHLDSFFGSCAPPPKITMLLVSIVSQVSVNDEGRDMWQVYLDMKEYTAALAHCDEHKPFQKDKVYLIQVTNSFCNSFNFF